MLLKKNNTTNLHREQAKGVFSSHQKKKLYTPSHRMFEDTDEALNIDKNN
jgi:hypothetical protein